MPVARSPFSVAAARRAAAVCSICRAHRAAVVPPSARLRRSLTPPLLAAAATPSVFCGKGGVCGSSVCLYLLLARGCGSSVLDLPAACCGLSSPAAPSIISSCPTSCACAHCCFSAATHPSAALPARDVWVKFGPAGLLGRHFGLLEARLRWFAPHYSCHLYPAAAISTAFACCLLLLISTILCHFSIRVHPYHLLVVLLAA